MGQEPVEGRDYDRVIAKMPRYDKEGRDVTGDKMGPGGRRKDNGRQSVQAYDFEEYNEEESREELVERLRLYAEAEERERVLRKEHMQDGIETFFVFRYWAANPSQYNIQQFRGKTRNCNKIMLAD